MDTSPEYIKMCEKAGEIVEYGKEHFEKLRPLFVFDKLLGRVAIAIWCPKTLRKKLGQKGDEFIVSIEQENDGNIFIEEGTMGEVVWLPRQDELQDMLKGWTVNDLTFNFCREVDHYDSGDLFGEFADYYKQFTSMEQLWLAFVMKEKYQKTWNGEDWIDG